MTSSRRFSRYLPATLALLLAACGSQQPGNEGNAASGKAAGQATPGPGAKAGAASGNAVKAEPKADRKGPALPASHPWSASGYALNGTEPFWGGSVSGSTVTYMTPEDQFGDTVAVTAAYSPAQEVYSGALAGQPFVLTLTAGPCSNGMSEHSFAFTATLQVKGETRQGCADPQ
ncbi:MAG TPA: hypothetical protein VF759_03465 [Allosphingosinicella sp.]